MNRFVCQISLDSALISNKNYLNLKLISKNRILCDINTFVYFPTLHEIQQNNRRKPSSKMTKQNSRKMWKKNFYPWSTKPISFPNDKVRVWCGWKLQACFTKPRDTDLKPEWVTIYGYDYYYYRMPNHALRLLWFCFYFLCSLIYARWYFHACMGVCVHGWANEENEKRKWNRLAFKCSFSKRKFSWIGKVRTWAKWRVINNTDAIKWKWKKRFTKRKFKTMNGKFEWENRVEEYSIFYDGWRK